MFYPISLTAEFHMATSSNTIVLTKTKYFIILPSPFYLVSKQDRVVIIIASGSWSTYILSGWFSIAREHPASL